MSFVHIFKSENFFVCCLSFFTGMKLLMVSNLLSYINCFHLVGCYYQFVTVNRFYTSAILLLCCTSAIHKADQLLQHVLNHCVQLHYMQLICFSALFTLPPLYLSLSFRCHRKFHLVPMSNISHDECTQIHTVFV